MTTLPMLTPTDCPRFSRCSAPICPLDPLRGRAVHLPGEPVCGYLLATGKVGAGEKYAADPVYATCAERLPEIATRWPDIGRRVARSARSGFLGANLSGPVSNAITGCTSGKNPTPGEVSPA